MCGLKYIWALNGEYQLIIEKQIYGIQRYMVRAGRRAGRGRVEWRKDAIQREKKATTTTIAKWGIKYREKAQYSITIFHKGGICARMYFFSHGICVCICAIRTRAQQMWASSLRTVFARFKFLREFGEHVYACVPSSLILCNMPYTLQSMLGQLNEKSATV